ncbi:MAG: class I SAM-dependent methyltransferase [Syntrophaceae bacterium]|nr:class I SAM-dependent methyltransferase [Syntrophaceae bacterium]
MDLDAERLNDLMGRAVADMGAAASGVLVIIGDRLGLFTALAQHAPLLPGKLAELTGTQERMVREWLAAMAASGYILYEPADGTFRMTPEQIALLADPDSPFFLASAYPCIAALYKDEPIVTAAFRHGLGVGWDEHHADLFHGTERFFSRVYENFLIPVWLPSLGNVVEKLAMGAVVADIGCGHGATTLLMARSFPKSLFLGFDAHEPSIQTAAQRLEETDLVNVIFRTCPAETVPPENYDLVVFCDSFHEMGNPAGIAGHMRNVLSPDGTLMLIEQKAEDRIEENFHPAGRMGYSFSTMICVPGAIRQGAEEALGNQAGLYRLETVLRAGGFSRIRKTVETPLHMVIEAKK